MYQSIQGIKIEEILNLLSYRDYSKEASKPRHFCTLQPKFYTQIWSQTVQGFRESFYILLTPSSPWLPSK
ncbi:hypothetical protein CHS0354_006607 [Potamilus streckersoni]|uniref:Uncharacterized protein n=1 Tax=Potamilus streckersoni TaxID=2493646 RepID=A0AAE0SXN2_9BIVA|nr:hypothetical protein CHS0354_006607 [Potamilus streckersoni]